MKQDKILASLQPIKNFIIRFKVILFIVCVGAAIGFMTIKIAYYSNSEPSEDQIAERKNSLRTVKLNEEAVAKIEELKDQNINLESLFNNGRANPFE